MEARHIAPLWPEECMARLGTEGTGRFVFDAERGPVALPVHYCVIEGDVYFLARSGGSIDAGLPGAPVSFEVDGDDGSDAWSVLLTGRAEEVRVPEAVARLDAHLDLATGTTLVADGGERVWVRFVPIERSGRAVDAT